MNEIIMTSENLPEFENKKLTTVTKKIYELNGKIKKNIFLIALQLAKVEEEKLYENDGFKSTVDFAEQVFGYKRSAVFDMLKVGNEYLLTNGETNLPHGENDFTMGQVKKMLPLGHETAVELVENEKITSNMSCREIEQIVKNHNNKDVEETEKIEETEETEKTEETEETEKTEDGTGTCVMDCTIMIECLESQSEKTIIFNGTEMSYVDVINKLSEWYNN